MSAPDRHTREALPSALPAEILSLLEQAPTAANVASLHDQLFEPGKTVEFWRTASEKDLMRVGAWAFMNKAHAFGIPAMMLGSLVFAGLVSVAFWGQSGAGLLLKCLEVVALFLLVFIAMFNLLYIPLSPLWNRLFGCATVSRIIRCLRPLPLPLGTMVQNCVMPGADARTAAAVTKYLEDVQARRPFVVQDIRVAFQIAEDSTAWKV